MRKGLTELVCILDKSGSMAGLEQDTIGGYRAMIEKQKAVDGECLLTSVLFNQRCDVLHDRIDIRAASALTEAEYSVGGSTALIDAIGETIEKIQNVQTHTSEAYRAEKVVFVIITDGAENASRTYSSDQVKAMIERQKTLCGWEFLFLGANIDAVQTAAGFGIASNRSQNYHADREGVQLNFNVVSDAVASFRSAAEIPCNWSSRIEEDYCDRRGNRP